MESEILESVEKLYNMQHEFLMATERLNFIHEIGYNHLLDDLGLEDSERDLLYGFFHSLAAIKEEFIQLRDKHEKLSSSLKFHLGREDQGIDCQRIKQINNEVRISLEASQALIRAEDQGVKLSDEHILELLRASVDTCHTGALSIDELLGA